MYTPSFDTNTSHETIFQGYLVHSNGISHFKMNILSVVKNTYRSTLCRGRFLNLSHDEVHYHLL